MINIPIRSTQSGFDLYDEVEKYLLEQLGKEWIVADEEGSLCHKWQMVNYYKYIQVIATDEAEVFLALKYGVV